MNIDKVIINLPSNFNNPSGSDDEYSENENNLENNHSESNDDSDAEYVEELSQKEKNEIKKKVHELLKDINS